MTEDFDETFTQRELQEQFKPLLPKVAPVQASFQNS